MSHWRVPRGYHLAYNPFLYYYYYDDDEDEEEDDEERKQAPVVEEGAREVDKVDEGAGEKRRGNGLWKW